MSLAAPLGKLQPLAAGLLALGMSVTVGTALAFQHLGGYIPCKLCLEQRFPFYLAIPIALLALAAWALKLPAPVARVLLLAVAIVMSWSVYLGVYHAGVEWSLWAGPADCGVVAAPTISGGAGVLDALDTVVPPSCDDAAGRFLGLSFAGWNVVASTALAAIAYVAAFRRA